ncbi:MAG: PAS domain S-box protein [Bacteroidota bacterium]
MNNTVKILLVEDNPIDVMLIRELLKKSSYSNSILIDVKSLHDALFYAKEDILVLLLDLGLPDSNGIDTVRLIRENFPDCAIIVLTGLEDDTIAAESLRLGAQNYLTKNQIDSKVLDKTIRFAIERHVFVQKLKKADKELIHANRLYSFISQINQTIVHSHDEQTVLKRACKIAIEYGMFKSAWIGMFDHINKKINLIEESGMLHQDIALFANAPFENKGPQEHVLRFDSYYVCNNIQADPELSSWKPVASNRNWNSCMVLPIRKSGKIIGTINLYSDEIDFFNKKEITLLVEATGDISFALDIFEKDKQRIHTEQRLKQSELRYREFFDTAPEVIIVMDAETGAFIDYNNNALKLFKLSGVQFLKKSPPDVSPPMQPDGKTSAEKSTEMILAATHGENPIFDWVVRDSEGKDIYCEVRLTVLTNPDRKLIRCNLFEITERKQAQEKLMQSEFRYRQIVETANEGIWTIDENNKTTFVNKKLCEILEYSEEEMIGKENFDFMDKEGIKIAKEKITRRKKGVSENEEIRFISKSRKDVWTKLLVSPILGIEGKYKGALAMVTDITEKRKAELKLQESETFNKGILSSLSAHIAVIDENGTIIAVNKAWDDFAKANGATSLERVSVGSNYFEVCKRAIEKGELYAAQSLAGIQSIFKKEKQYFEMEYPCHSPDEQRWFTLRVKNFGSDIQKVVIAHQNITERKIAENNLSNTSVELQKTLTDLNKILDSSIDVICTINANGEFVKISAASQKVWGYPPGELIGSKFMNLVYHEDADITIKAAETIISGTQIPIFENRYVHKSGRVVPILWSLNWDEKLKLMFCIAKDITEKKRLEKTVENERDRFSEMFLRAPASMAMLKGPNHIFQMANDLYLNLTDRKNIVGQSVRDVFPEVESQGFIDLLNHVYKTGESYIGKEVLVKLKKPGTEELSDVYLNFVYQAYHNRQNEIEGIFAFIIDITEQQKAKENLLATSERLLLATTSAKMGIWDWDIANDIMTWDNRMYELYGIGKQHFTGAVNVWQNGVHPDDIERAGKEINDAISGIRDFDTEFKIIWPDKSVHFIEAHAIVSRDEAGVAVRMIGINIDITERKTAEEKVIRLNEEVTKSEKFFKGVLENSDDMITIISPTGKTIYASPAVSKKFGYTNEECLQINIADIVHPDDALIMQEFVMRIMLHPGVPMECPLIRNRKKDGSYVWVEGTLTNFLETEGINAIVANFRDITDRKKADELLQQSQSNLKAVIENTDASIYSLDLNYRYITFNKLLHETLKQIYHLDIKPGDNVYSFLDKLNPSESKEWKEVYSKALGGETVKFEKEFHIGDFYNCSSFSIHPIWEMDEVIGLSCFAYDISKQKQGELQKEKMTADIVQRNKNLEQFSYIVSHNLRAPIANIIGFSDLLKSGELAQETVAELNEGLSTSAKKLDEVIKDLNHILHIKRNVSEEKEIVNLSQLATDIYISIETLIAKEDATIVWDFTEVNEILIIKSYLYSIFTNLITNSIKYRQPNIPPAIKIKSFKFDNKIILTFTDNGMGIDLEKKGDQVFGLYKRFHTNRAEGKGMGLFMVKTQVETIGGTISITSEVNKGTEFKIEF